jgi:hypothetical protein
MKNVNKLEQSLESNHFHPLNFFVPSNIRQIKPYEVMYDSTILSVFSFYSESQDKDLFLKVSTSEKRQYNENLTYMLDSLPECMLKKFNSFSFTEKDGKSNYYSVFQIVDMTLDDFISERLENLDEICTNKNTVNPSFIKHGTPEPMNNFQEEDLIREDEMIYIIKDIIY